MTEVESRVTGNAYGVTVAGPECDALAARLAVIRWDERIARLRRRQAEIAAANRPFARVTERRS